VTDEAGNPLATGTAAFLGWGPDPVAGRAWRIWEQMIPVKNRTEDAALGDLRRFVGCLDEQLAWNLYHVDRWTDRFNPDLASDTQIDELLADLGNPFAWTDLDLTANQRRRLLRLLVDIYRLKGTAVGIEDTIRLLLGVTCTVVEAAGIGWRLGYDALGVGRVAQLTSAVGPYNLLAVLPSTLAVSADGGAAETATVTATAFVDPTAATAQEIAAVLAPQWTAAIPVAEASGTPPTVTGGLVEPFALSGGETLTVDVNGVAQTLTLHVGDITLPGAATAAEVAARLTLDGAGFLAGGTSGGAVTVTAALAGATATLTITGGTAAAILGLAGASATGTDAGCLVVRGVVTGADHTLTVAAGALQAALGLPITAVSTGGCILAAGDQRLKYSFDLEVATAPAAATETLMRRIADYMKPAHTHLLRVRVPRGAPPAGAWRLGEDRLGISTVLGL
jgi:phage tail-like protein